MKPKLSLIIPARDKNDPKLADLLQSIDAQDFPKDQMEVLVITEGTSESAKAIGIRRARGEVIGILASDNTLEFEWTLSELYRQALHHGASHPAYYCVNKEDDILTRYFALMGSNDPLAYYMNKHDRSPQFTEDIPRFTNGRTIGDNGFFIKRSLIENTDLDNYYHIDNANEASIWHSVPEMFCIRHNTGGNLFKFFSKRYRYGLEHAFNPNRRWHLVDFRKPKDIARLTWFILCSLTLIHPLLTSLRGFLKIRDVAWFYHPLVCFATTCTYGVLVFHVMLRRMFQSSSVPTAERRA
ncbi:MAG TPA: glycosyltransferase family 2 protein [Nitrososphaera sp.]|nr:glycosyltransferase family 2 protein [Nitrososphaera sp.]